MPLPFTRPSSASSTPPASSGSPRLGLPGVGVAPTWERPVAILLIILFLVLGGIVLKRSAFSDRRRTDAGVFFRAGYAVRNGIDPYRIVDNNDWYYLYPPGVAAFFVPLADSGPAGPLPPVNDPRSTSHLPGYLPYPVSIAIWYAFSVGILALALHWIVQALQEGSPRPEIRSLTSASGGWWNIRLWPVLMCLPDIGSTLSKGQVNLQILACICAGTLLLVRAERGTEPIRGRRSFWGGFSLAGAACIKVFPGLILIWLLVRRNWQAIAGAIACAVVFLVLLPIAVYGPAHAVAYTWEFTQHVLLAGLGLNNMPSLQAGSSFSNTDNIAIQGALHNLINIATPRGQRPDEPATWVRITHITVSLGLLLATLWVGRRGLGEMFKGSRKRTSSSSPLTGAEIVLRIGMLCCVMLLALPMCHRHYPVLVLPAVAGLVFVNVGTSRLGTLQGWGWALGIGYPLLMSLPRFQQEGVVRDLPIPLLAILILWSASLVLLERRRTSEDPTAEPSLT